MQLRTDARRALAALTVGAGFLLGAPGPASARHEGGQAMLTGDTVSGVATNKCTLVPYGQCHWDVSLHGDLAPGTYTFLADGSAICSFEVGGLQSNLGCSTTTTGAPFGADEGSVRDSVGNTVAYGIFENHVPAPQ